MPGTPTPGPSILSMLTYATERANQLDVDEPLLVMPSPLSKIVSGSQAGVDRGALDAALVAGFPRGRWCPEERKAEDWPIPQRYPV